MTELYRGLLLVLTGKFYELILSFRSHVQMFKKETTDPTIYFDVGVLGFWNLLLEIVLTMFSLICLIFGVILVASLAIVFYPFHALAKFGSLIVTITRDPHHEMTSKTDDN